MNIYALWLHNIPGLGRKKAVRFLEAGICAKELYTAGDKEKTDLCRAVFGENSAAAEGVRSALLKAGKQDAEDLGKITAAKGLDFVSLEDKAYPERLRNTPDAPYGLYFRGKLPSDKMPSIAIIGARVCSRYGLEQAARFAGELAACGIQVVSGLARGIDGAAGRAASEFGRSFAVMGCGANICYPTENAGIYDRIAQTGGILSEYPPDTPPKPTLFPPRNRIISGLADAVLVIEARKKSGTLITVDMALEQGRDIFAVPGRVCDGLSEGCNLLLRAGAEAACSPGDLLEYFFGIREGAHAGKTNMQGSPSAGRPIAALTSLEETIISLLKETEHAETDALVTGAAGILGRRVSVRETASALMQLQLKGLVTESEGGYYDLAVENGVKRRYNPI